MPDVPAIVVPPVLDQALAREDAALVISISGGKDSQAMLAALVTLHRERGWRSGLFAIHADLGRTEWAESLPHCQKLCDELGVFLKVVRRPQGDLLQEIQQRMAKLAARAETAEAGASLNPWPTASMRYCTADQKRGQLQKAKRTAGWPDAANRYCTSDQKRTQIDKALRAPHWPSAANRYCTAHQKQHQIDPVLREYRLVVSAMGMRAQESRARSKKDAFQLDQDLTAIGYRRVAEANDLDAALRLFADVNRPAERDHNPLARWRLAFEWLPIHTWSVHEVWAACGTSAEDLARRQKLYRLGWTEEALAGWPAHPAYVYGNERVSCSLCVLASQNDLAVGARHNPELFRTYVEMERESGFTFQQGRALADVAPDLVGGPPLAPQPRQLEMEIPL